MTQISSSLGWSALLLLCISGMRKCAGAERPEAHCICCKHLPQLAASQHAQYSSPGEPHITAQQDQRSVHADTDDESPSTLRFLGL